MIFPQNVITAAQAAEKETGCPACITLAQWDLESGGGKYMSAPNNYFGIKWHESCNFPFKTVSTHEVYNGKYVVVMAKFIDFPTLSAAFKYHGRLIVSHNPHSPYADAQSQLAKGWKLFLEAMAKHYATDPHYASKLENIIATNRLEQYNLK